VKTADNLPLLRNPDILLGENDLTSLSYLHEPAGDFYCSSKNSCCLCGSDGLYCFCRIFFSVSTRTHEPLHSAWRSFAGTFIVTKARNTREFQGHRSKVLGCFFCVRDTAATRGQYLALSRAWWSHYVHVWLYLFRF